MNQLTNQQTLSQVLYKPLPPPTNSDLLRTEPAIRSDVWQAGRVFINGVGNTGDQLVDFIQSVHFAIE